MTFIEEMASRHNVDVRFEKNATTDAYVIGNTIVLDPDLYEPRMNWRFCHELAHIILGHTKQDTVSQEMELEAESYAAELMLPTAEFRPLVCSMDVGKLKELFPHASWEVIARRWAEFRPAVITIFDNGRQTSRWGPQEFNYPLKLTSIERSVISKCYDIRESITESDSNFSLTAYFIDVGSGVERVILLTELLDY